MVVFFVSRPRPRCRCSSPPCPSSRASGSESPGRSSSPTMPLSRFLSTALVSVHGSRCAWSSSSALATPRARRSIALLTTPFSTPSDALRPTELLVRVGLPRRGGGVEVVRLGGEGDRRVREAKRLLVADNAGWGRERALREETSCGTGVPFRGGLGGGEGGSLGDSLAVGGSGEGSEWTDSGGFWGGEMTRRASSCSGGRVKWVSLDS